MTDCDMVLVPGAGSDTWYLQPLARELDRLGHRSTVVDLPSGEPDAGLDDYRRCIVDTCRHLRDPVLVAHSFGAFSASLAAADVGAAALVLVAPMIPAPGEPGADWWTSTDHAGAVQHDPDDPAATFFHDVPPGSIEAIEQHSLDQSARPFETPWPLDRWPAVPTQIIIGLHDRFFPVAFQQRLAAARVGVPPRGHRRRPPASVHPARGSRRPRRRVRRTQREAGPGSDGSFALTSRRSS